MNYSSVLSRVVKTKAGKNALARYRRFWGLKSPPAIKVLDVPGMPKNGVLVGLGRCPALSVANGPRGEATKVKRSRHTGIVATNPSGTRLYILSGKSARRGGSRKLKFLGYAPMTEYIPTKAMEKSGTFKKGKWWQHKHHDNGGKWPKIYKDSAGNIIYAKGTYRVGKWIER